MKLTERDEILIQRCVDGEMSAEETASLLRRLDALEHGWKHLACGLMEDRTLRRILADRRAVVQKSGENVSGTPLPASSGHSSASAANRPGGFRQLTRRWWSHPLTSLTLCAAIAFVGGMLIQDQWRSDSAAATGLASGRVVQEGPAGGAMAVSQAGDWKFQLPGQRPVNVPVYQRPGDLMQIDRNHPLFQTESNRNSVRWLIVPAGDGKSMLLPVSDALVPQIQ
jgi:phosphatidylserine/phosphatidylglycerophosphate/cardiolipin synthase-like enzyme